MTHCGIQGGHHRSHLCLAVFISVYNHMKRLSLSRIDTVMEEPHMHPAKPESRVGRHRHLIHAAGRLSRESLFLDRNSQ